MTRDFRGSRPRAARLAWLLIAMSAVTIVIAAGSAAATVDAGSLLLAQNDVGASTARESAGDSLAGAFFISRRTDATGEQSIEWLGSVIIWFLLLLSAMSLGLIGMLALTNQRKSIVPHGAVESVRGLLLSGKFREALELTRGEDSYFSRIMHAALREASHGFGAVIRSLEQSADEMTTRRLRRVEYLNILGQVSPMIGLFGTVYGMILAFQAIVVSGGDADPVQLAGGIGTALTTTFWGLVVAIPALASYAVLRNKIDELSTEAVLAAEEILNQFRTRASQSSRSGEVRTGARATDGDE